MTENYKISDATITINSQLIEIVKYTYDSFRIILGVYAG